MQTIDISGWSMEEIIASMRGGAVEPTVTPVEAPVEAPIAVNPSPVYRVRELPWEAISTDVRGTTHIDDLLNKAGLNYRVIQEPLFRTGNRMLKHRVSNIREDTDEFIEVVSTRYTPVQNSTAMRFLEAISTTGAIELERAGATGFSKIFIQAKMKKFSILGDEIQPYVIISNSHDTTGGVKVALTPDRIWCTNILTALLKNSPRIWQAKHIGTIEGRMEEAQNLMKLADDYHAELPVFAEALNQITLSEPDLVTVLKRMFPVKKDAGERAVRNAAHQARDILSIYNSTPDLTKFHGTAWGFFNAVGDYVTHHTPKETTGWRETRMERIVNGHPLMNMAQAALMAVPA